MTTVHELRKQGYKVRVFHNRRIGNNYTINGSLQSMARPRGGSTLVMVVPPQTNYGVIGCAECSDKDNYNKKLGVSIALGRALKKLKNGETCTIDMMEKMYGKALR